MENYIKLDTAKALKKLNFDWNVCGFYLGKNHWGRNTASSLFHEGSGVPAPTQSVLQKWLREKYFMHPHIYKSTENGKWGVDCYDLQDKGAGYAVGLLNNPCRFVDYDTYEDALEVGLQFMLKQIKK